MNKATYLFLLLLLLFLPQAKAQNAPNPQSDTLTASPTYRDDTLSISGETDETTVFRGKKLIAAASLIALGAVTTSVPQCREWNKKWRNKMSSIRNGHYIHADDYLQYVPSIAHIGLSLLGAKASHSYLERTCVLATSYATMGILVNSLKHSVRKRRPDSRARNSFPSGHTATVFMGAELVRLEYKNDSRWYGIGAYAIACGVGFLRTYNNRHWLSDVFAGAGIGLLSAHVGYWLLPLERKIFRLNKKKQNTSLLLCPYYDNDHHGGGVLLSTTF